MSVNVKGKVVIITGAASGLGKGMADKLAKNGSFVVIADLDLKLAQATADEIKGKYNIDTFAVQMNVVDEDEVNKGVAATVAKFGKIDVLISNAGIQVISPIVDFDTSVWKKVVDIHLHGTFLTTKACMKQMIAQKTGGRILVTGSIHSIEASKNKAAYVAAMHGKLGFVRSIAKEGAEHNISSNLICPAFVKTPLVEKQIPEQAKALGITEEEVIKKVMLGDTVDYEFTTVEDIADTALFLAGFETNALTGQHILVSHGIGM